MQSLDTEPCVDKTPDAPSDWSHTPWDSGDTGWGCWSEDWREWLCLDWGGAWLMLCLPPPDMGVTHGAQLRVSESPWLRPLPPPALITSGTSRHQPRREATVTTLWERGCGVIIAVRLFSYESQHVDVKSSIGVSYLHFSPACRVLLIHVYFRYERVKVSGIFSLNCPGMLMVCSLSV